MRSRSLMVLLITVVCFVLAENIMVEAHPLNKMGVNIPGNILIRVDADPNRDTAADLKTKVALEMKRKGMKSLNMNERALIYFQMVIPNEKRKLSYYHVPKGATLYLV